MTKSSKKWLLLSALALASSTAIITAVACQSTDSPGSAGGEKLIL